MKLEKRPIRDLVCPACGKQFQTKERTQTFCCFKCARTKGNGIKPKMTTRICPTCGKEFSIRCSDHRIKGQKTIYCSRKCYLDHYPTIVESKEKTVRTHYERENIERTCPVCEKKFYVPRYKSNQKTCSRECGIKLRSINYEHKTYYENGYICEFRNGYNKKGNVKQHRRIMEEHLGRRLEKWEVVHHINGDRTDNRIENLQLMTWGEHSSLHRKEEKAKGKQLFGGYHNN